jgi:hypothetical protein
MIGGIIMENMIKMLKDEAKKGSVYRASWKI